jgi:hypothetical protein
MELKGLLAALRSEREQIDKAILALKVGAEPNSKKTEGLRAAVVEITEHRNALSKPSLDIFRNL